MFISRALDAWAYFNKVKLDYSRLCTPTDNPHIESFNGSFRDECLNMNLFMSLEDARDKVERWRRDYNEFRPHSATLYPTPAEFAPKMGIEVVYDIFLCIYHFRSIRLNDQTIQTESFAPYRIKRIV